MFESERAEPPSHHTSPQFHIAGAGSCARSPGLLCFYQQGDHRGLTGARASQLSDSGPLHHGGRTRNNVQIGKHPGNTVKLGHGRRVVFSRCLTLTVYIMAANVTLAGQHEAPGLAIVTELANISRSAVNLPIGCFNPRFNVSVSLTVATS